MDYFIPSYFGIPSYIQKRLFRYVLTHVPVIDTRTLDLDQLDIALGQRNSFELRDIGLHVEKLSQILHLPDNLQATKARILLAKVTVPTDFHRNGITVEVKGIDIEARLSQKEGIYGKDQQRSSTEPGRKEPDTRKRATFGEDPFEDDDHLPTAHELAESFLKEEPEEDIKELEAAVQSYAHEVGSSASETSEDEDIVGTGTVPSLPTFLVNFMNGAADRFMLTIENVKFTLDAELPPGEIFNDLRLSSGSRASVSFHVGAVGIEGITSGSTGPAVGAGQPDAPAPVRNKRRVYLEHVAGYLVTDPVLFSSLDRPSTTHSPVATSSRGSLHSSSISTSFHGRNSPLSARAPPRRRRQFGSDSALPSDPSQPALSNDGQLEQSMEARFNEFQAARSTDEVLSAPTPPVRSDRDRFADASDDEDDDDDGADYTASQLAYLKRSGPFQGISDSELLEQDFPFNMDDSDHSVDPEMDEHELYASPSASLLLHSTAPESPESLAEPSRGRRKAKGHKNMSGTMPLPPSSHSDFPSTAGEPMLHRSQHQPTHSPELQSAAPLDAALSDYSSGTPSPPRSASSSSGSSQPHSDQEDLSQSKIFSHEEAESMYMSAMSDVGNKTSSHYDMPGGWDQGSVSSGRSDPVATSHGTQATLAEQQIHKTSEESGLATPRPGSPSSSSASSPQGDTRDNLEHARTANAMSSSSHAADRSEETGDGAETPISIKRVAKRLLTVDDISLLLPWASRPEEPDNGPGTMPVDMSVSTFSEFSAYGGMPGAFSPHSSRLPETFQRPSSPPPRVRQARFGEPSMALSSRSPENNLSKAPDVEVEVGTVTGQMDISTGKLLFLVFQQLLESWSSPPSTREDDTDDENTNRRKKGTHEKSTKSEKKDEKASTKAYKVFVRKVSLAFLEQMPSSLVVSQTSSSDCSRSDEDFLFKLGIDGITLSAQVTPAATNATAEIQKFRFGSPEEDMICFNGSVARSTSKETVQRKNDISVTFSNALPRGPEVHVQMRTLLISLDMHKLDERLSCFGGLSGMLDLSSSIASNSTVLAASPNARGKAVRFDAPQPAATAGGFPPVKMNVKIEGMVFDLYGKACGITLRTSAMKLVVREDKARFQISHINFEGPFDNITRVEAPLSVNVKDTQFIFLFAPEENDLSDLVALITPSRDKYEDDDDILLDTLLRQRQKGSLLRVSILDVQASVKDIEKAQGFRLLSDEISKLSSVAKMLPEDDRPGLLTIATVQSISAEALVNNSIGTVLARCGQLRLAHVGLPALFAFELGTIGVTREHEEELVSPLLQLQPNDRLPMVMARVIGDELEPTIKVKLFNLAAEYRIPTVLALMGLTKIETMEDLAASMVASVATIRGESASSLERQNSGNTSSSRAAGQPLHVDLLLRDCAIGLNPYKRLSKGIFLFTNARLTANASIKEDFNIKVELREASLLLTDDSNNIDLLVEAIARLKLSESASPAISDLSRQGFQSVATITDATIIVLAKKGTNGSPILDVDMGVGVFVMESCADSTQTLSDLLNGLSPPVPAKEQEHFRTKVVPITDMMASFTGESFAMAEKNTDDELDMDNADYVLEDLPSNMDFVGSFYNPEGDVEADDQPSSPVASVARSSIYSAFSRPKDKVPFSAGIEEKFEHGDTNVRIDVSNDYLKTLDSKAPVRRWHPNTNRFKAINKDEVRDSPVKVKAKIGTLIWNLFDGYDWAKTREKLTQAIENVEARVAQRRRERERAPEDANDSESEIGDFLFQSVWIAVPPNAAEHDLQRQINRNMDDQTSDTATVTTIDSRSSRPPHQRRKSKRQNFMRSRRKKISFHLGGVSADVLVLPPGSEITQMSLMVKVEDLEIYDHVPSSTWRKFMTYNHDHGERQMGQPMLRLEVVGVRPVPELAASELVLKVNVLPVRLHVDQDALDFITRFFEFKDKDEEEEDSPPPDGPFIQRIEIPTVPVKLDYKPKKVDYASLRSGHTSEFANFFTLDGAELQLKHLIYYGIESPDRIQGLLKGIWTNDVLANQLPTVLSGLAVARPFVDLGSAIGGAIVVPMREYKKDGRIVRSVQKGLSSFTRTTTRELARFGARVAIGTQNMAEGLETLTAPTSTSHHRRSGDWSDDDDFSSSPREETRALSNYAAQPLNVMTGFKTAFTGLERDLMTVKDAIIAIGSDVRDSESATGAAGAILRRTPTVLLRPVIGGTKAIGTALSGVGNALDRESERKIHDKYKSRGP